ncbi:SDR family oxidoreductase [Mucilaginibacter defluvii]|uniref:SDR family oxidoreductase n=1 Tax=Mucilaginibacter defluvii TaxID=1196019 RepID=A0ABP9FKQ9_9SPHI
MNNQTSVNNGSLTSLKEKNIIITGGTTGIGRATALLLANRGANVLITGLDENHLKDTLSDAESKGIILKGIITDMATEQGINELFAEAYKHFSRLDILINNAALAFQGVSDGEYKDWHQIINTNITGYIACTHHAIKRMQQEKSGHIINVGSMSADVREKDSSVYVATKAAIQGFSESVRKEVNELGIKVTLIEPGATGTDMQPVSVPDQQQKIEDLEMLRAEDIAASIFYALSQPMRCDVVEIKVKPHLQII